MSERHKRMVFAVLALVMYVLAAGAPKGYGF
jgi:hypothetical protein